MGIPISFEDVEVSEIEPLPVGKYPARVSNLEYTEAAKSSGEPAIAWEFTVSDGEFVGRKGFFNNSLQPQSLWSVARVLMALGYTEEEVKNGEWDFEDPDIIEELIDRECGIVIGHEKYDGEVVQRVKKVVDIGKVADSQAAF